VSNSAPTTKPDTSSFFAPTNLSPNPTGLFNPNLLSSVQNIVPPPSTTNNNPVFSPTINVSTTAQDPKEIGRIALAEMESLFKQSQMGLLAP